MFDEFIFFKGVSPYTSDNYTPPTGPWTAEGVISQPVIISNPEPIPIIAPLDISSGDFCLEVDFRLNNLFMWTPYTDGTPNFEAQYYGIIGQFTQYETGEIVDYGNYWVIYLRVNSDYTTDIVFEVFVDGAIVTQLVHRTEITWSAWSEITKTNLDEFLHIAVSRNNDTARLFVGGYYSDVATSSGAMVDFTTINGSWQLNGVSGQPETYQPYSITSINNLRVFDYVYHWDDYDYVDWTRGSGIKMYPRVGIKMVDGFPGGLRARLAI